MEYLVEGKDYTLIDGVLTINEGVTHIPSKNFENNTKVHEIVLPNSLVYIGSYAFHGCNLLNNGLIIPNSVKYIFEYAFSECYISNLTLGESVIYIGLSSFAENGINKIENKSTKLKLIDVNAFKNNLFLNAFTYNGKEKLYIEDSSFINTGVILENVNQNVIVFDIFETHNSSSNSIPEYVCCFNTKDKYTFENGILKINDDVEIIGSFEDLGDECIAVKMPDSVIHIENNAFKNLKNLKSIKFSNNLISIGENSFFGCGLRNKIIVLPNSLCAIDLSSFRSNTGEEKIYIPDRANTYWDDEDENDKVIYEAYTRDYDTLVNNRTISLDSLLEYEINLLNSLNLLPITIMQNSKLKNSVNDKQKLVLKKSLIDFITSTDYDETKSINIVKGLLELKEIDVSDLHELVDYLFSKRQINTIYMLISYGYNCFDNCMISKAIINNLYNMIDILLLLGVNINEIGKVKMTPLSIACDRDDYQLALHLIEKGAAIDMEDMNGKKAIDYAIENDDKDLVNLLGNCKEKTTAEIDLEKLNKILGK